jgi:hypothetical protein
MATDAAGLWPIGDETAAHSGAPTEQEAAAAAQALAGMLLAPLALLSGCQGVERPDVQGMQQHFLDPAIQQCVGRRSLSNAEENCPENATNDCTAACQGPQNEHGSVLCNQVCSPPDLEERITKSWWTEHSEFRGGAR